MPVINFKSETGSLLTGVVYIVIFIALIGLIAASLTTSGNKSQLVHAEEQKAFFAAQSGIEYAMKQIVSADTLTEWTEDNLATGNNNSAKVEVKFLDPNTLEVTSWGKSSHYVKKLSTTVYLVDSSDVSNYAVYSTNTVKDVVTKDSLNGSFNPSLIFENAPNMPAFDLNQLRSKAQQDGYYYNGDLVVNPAFSPSKGAIVFVEGNMKLVKGHWSEPVHFVVMGDVTFIPSWKTSSNVPMSIYQPDENSSLSILNNDDEENEDVDFDIEGGDVIPSESFAAQATVIGSAISYSGWYDIPVTLKLKISGTEYSPFGDYTKPLSGNVNDEKNPRSFNFPNLYSAGTPISIIAKSWVKKSLWYSGKKNSHWMSYMTVNASQVSPYVKVLRDGDPVPDIEGFLNQNNIQDYVENYVNSQTGQISLEKNQAIYLFELGTTNLNSPAADFQDLVVLITLAKSQDQLDNGGGGGGSGGSTEYLTFTGGILTKGKVYGTYSDDGNTMTLQVIHGRSLIRDFLDFSINEGPRVILESTWKNYN